MPKHHLPALLCLALLMPVLALAAEKSGEKDKPLIPLKKNRWVDLATVVTPKDAITGKWVIRAKNLGIDARDEPSMVYMPFPVRPLGSYEMYVGVTADDATAEMTIDIPAGKNMTQIKFDARGMWVGDLTVPNLRMTPRKMYTMTLKFDAKKGNMEIYVDDWRLNLESEPGATLDAGDTRMKAGAKAGRVTFQNLKVRSTQD